MNYIRKEYEKKESNEKDELCKERIRIMVKKNENKINFVRKTEDEPYQKKKKRERLTLKEQKLMHE